MNTFPFAFTDLGTWPKLFMKDINPYIEMNVIQNEKYFENGKRITKPKKVYKFKDCTAEDF